MMPADTHSAAAHHMTAAVTRTPHRMAMMPASTPNGMATAMPTPVAAATHSVPATMASSPAVTAALLGVGEGRGRNGDECGKRDARKAGHGRNLHGPVRPKRKRRGGQQGSGWNNSRAFRGLRCAGSGDPRTHRFVRHPPGAGAGIVGHVIRIAGSWYRAGDGGMTDDELEQELRPARAIDLCGPIGEGAA